MFAPEWMGDPFTAYWKRLDAGWGWFCARQWLRAGVRPVLAKAERLGTIRMYSLIFTPSETLTLHNHHLEAGRIGHCKINVLWCTNPQRSHWV
jgi:hypothetical protein